MTSLVCKNCNKASLYHQVDVIEVLSFSYIKVLKKKKYSDQLYIDIMQTVIEPYTFRVSPGHLNQLNARNFFKTSMISPSKSRQ